MKPISLFLLFVAAAHHPVPDDSVDLTIADVRGMTDAERVELFTALFEARLQKAQNVRYHSEVILKNHKYRNNEIGEEVWDGFRFVNRRVNLGDSWRIEHERYDGEGNADKLYESEVFGYDAQSGEKRVYGSNDQGLRGGRIGTEHNSHLRYDKMSLWFTGPEPTHQLSTLYNLFPYLLANRADWQFSFPDSPEDTTLKLMVPWKCPFGRSFTEAYVHVWLDSEKGFLPVRGERRYVRSETHWRNEWFRVDEAKIVDGIWIPMKMTDVVHGSALALAGMPDVANVFISTMSKIEFGTVTPEDLVIDFPEGIEVVDENRGLRFVVGPDRQETERAAVYVGSQIVTPPRSHRWPMIFACVLGAAAVASLWYIWRRRIRT